MDGFLARCFFSSLCLSLPLSLPLSASLCLSVCLCLSLSVSVSLSVCLSVCLSVSLSLSLSLLEGSGGGVGGWTRRVSSFDGKGWGSWGGGEVGVFFLRYFRNKMFAFLEHFCVFLFRNMQSANTPRCHKTVIS